jgi:uncharacterized protein YecE (DUF72 family)
MSESLRVGSYGWRHDHWRPNFYDDDLPEDWRLTFYANEFNAVLVPASYLDESRDIEQWCEDVNEDFQFYFEWPENMHSTDALVEELSSMGEKLGGILLSSNIQLKIDCPVYSGQANDDLMDIWQPHHRLQSDLAVLAIEQNDLRQQRQWLEAFMEDSRGKGRVVLLSDPILDIKALHDLKTLIELKGF